MPVIEAQQKVLGDVLRGPMVAPVCVASVLPGGGVILCGEVRVERILFMVLFSVWIGSLETCVSSGESCATSLSCKTFLHKMILF